MISIGAIILTSACQGDQVLPHEKNLLAIKEKWEGDYVGTVTRYSNSPWHPTTYDTLYDQKIRITNFTRDSVYPDYVEVTMEFNGIYSDSGYYGLELELLSDSAVLNRFDEGFTHKKTKITLNHKDSTLISEYINYAVPGGTNGRHGYYKRQ